MKPRQPIGITLLIVLGIITGAYYMFTQEWSFFSSILYWSTTIIGIVVVVVNESISKLIEIKKYKLLSEKEKQEYLTLCKLPYFKRLRQSALNKQDDRTESEMLIDHGFDGIVELDNALPKWWLGLFYFGVGYCIVYLISYFSTNFANPYVEYDIEIAKANKQVEDYWKTAPKITAETVEYKPELIEEGKVLFNSNCASCHKEGGAGGIGPNLTDDNWINVKQKKLIQNVFHMVWNGSENNPAMRGFGKGGELTGNDIQKIASYVYNINQEIPDINGGAAPQGEKATWEDAKK